VKEGDKFVHIPCWERSSPLTSLSQNTGQVTTYRPYQHGKGTDQTQTFHSQRQAHE